MIQRESEWSNEWIQIWGIHQLNQWMEGQSTQMGLPPSYTVQPRARFLSTWVHPIFFLFLFFFLPPIVIMEQHLHFVHLKFYTMVMRRWNGKNDIWFLFLWIINAMIRPGYCVFLEPFLNFLNTFWLFSLVFGCVAQKLTWKCSNIFPFFFFNRSLASSHFQLGIHRVWICLQYLFTKYMCDSLAGARTFCYPVCIFYFFYFWEPCFVFFPF